MMKVKSAKGKAHGTKFRGNQVQASKCLLPVESNKMYFILSVTSCKIHMKYHLPGKLIGHPEPRVFIGCYLYRYSLPNIYNISKCPVGK